MQISEAEYIRVQGYPILQLRLDGRLDRIPSEIKPTLIRHGLIPTSFEEYSTTMPTGERLIGVSDDPLLARLMFAFLLDCYHERFSPGQAKTNIDPTELAALGEEVDYYSKFGWPTWDEVTSKLLFFDS